jgi:DNA-binding XRE family transcriptional regulator
MPKSSEGLRLKKIPKPHREYVEDQLTRVARTLKMRRKELGLTQAELAEGLNVEVVTIQAIEQRRCRPSFEMFLAMIQVLKLKLKLE